MDNKSLQEAYKKINYHQAVYINNLLIFQKKESYNEKIINEIKI